MYCEKCHNTTDYKLISSGKVTYGYGTYKTWHCNKCGHDTTACWNEKPDKEEGGYYHDGGWYRANE